MVYSSKCTVKLGDPNCQETVVQLPRQGCPTKVGNTVDLVHSLNDFYFILILDHQC